MFLKKMGKFRPKLRSVDADYYGNNNNFQFSQAPTGQFDSVKGFYNFQICQIPAQSDSEQGFIREFMQQEVSGNLDEFSFSFPSPETPRPPPPNPNPTPEGGSQGDHENASMNDDEEDGDTDYNSCQDVFSEPASPFNLPKDAQKGKRKMQQTKQMMVLFTAVSAALMQPCGAGPDAVADDNLVRSKPSPSRQLDIGPPTKICHAGNADPNELEGLDMPKWMQGTERTRNHFGKCVPTLPHMMLDSLNSKGGLKVEGIFRINADSKEDERVRKELDRGNFPADVDVHCLAGLIKAWFREHPKGVFDSLTTEQVMRCNTEEDCLELVSLLPPVESLLLDWALNLMADVVDQQSYNKMNARNIATVFAPNMTRERIEDPLAAVKHVVQVINLLKTLINITVRKRERERERERSESNV